MHEWECGFLSVLCPSQDVGQQPIMGWPSVNDSKETDYHREILFPVFTAEAASTSVFDLLPMALPLPFNHGLSARYAVSGKITGEKI
jgi:hypothetical protein